MLLYPFPNYVNIRQDKLRIGHRLLVRMLQAEVKVMDGNGTVVHVYLGM